VTAALTVGLLVPGATVTWAATDPSSTPTPSSGRTVVVEDGTVTVTLDAAKVQALCAKAPELLDRVDRLRTRIQADASTSGSVAWLRVRAEQARADGRTAVAERLDDRADHRAARVDNLDAAAVRIGQAQATVCEPLADQLGDA
jgi:hypothetical protein